jgi:peptidoglycan hydrolase-like protein with peptidoglycan-binding domain
VVKVVADDGNQVQGVSQPQNAKKQVSDPESASLESLSLKFPDGIRQTGYDWSYCRFVSSDYQVRSSKWGEVGQVQGLLGYTVDGRFHGKLEKSIKNYQRKHQLKVTGCIDTATRKLMFPNSRSQSFREKSWNYAFAIRGKDYDHSTYRRSAKTKAFKDILWGPFRLSLKNGEIQKVLKKIPASALKLDSSQAVIFKALKNLSAGDAWYYARNLWRSSQTRAWIPGILSKTGGSLSGRVAYTTFLVNRLSTRMTSYSTLMNRVAPVTELDWAMFLYFALLDIPAETLESSFQSFQLPEDLRHVELRRKFWFKNLSQDLPQLKATKYVWADGPLSASYGLSNAVVKLK